MLLMYTILDTEKVEKDTEEVEKDEPNLQSSVQEFVNEVFPDSQYGSETSKENSKFNMKPPEELPPPVRDRTLMGGVDYYLLNDHIYDNQDY